MAVICCWRPGEVEVRQRLVEGSLTLARGPRARLEQALLALARHAYDGRTLLVPGLPEASDDDAALEAVLVFERRLRDRLERAKSAEAAP